MGRWIAILAVTLGCVGCAQSEVTSSSDVSDSVPAPNSCHMGGSGLFAYPDPRCTPGADNPAVTQETIGRTICAPGYSAGVRPPDSVTAPEKRAVTRAYGLTGSLSSYELDHWRAIENGGAPNAYLNYWPEPNYPGKRNNPKDKLENVLHKMICSHKMSLVDAKRAVSSDWVAAYHKYVGS